MRKSKPATVEQAEILNSRFYVDDGELFWKPQSKGFFSNAAYDTFFGRKYADRPAGGLSHGHRCLTFAFDNTQINRTVDWYISAIEGYKMAKKYNTPAPANAAEIQFAKECFVIKSNVLYWREDRPDHHFTRGFGKACWAKKSAGRPAGRVDGNHLRIATTMNGKPLNRSAAWFIEAITGEPPKPSKKLSFTGLMAIMNNNLNNELSEISDSCSEKVN